MANAYEKKVKKEYRKAKRSAGWNNICSIANYLWALFFAVASVVAAIFIIRFVHSAWLEDSAVPDAVIPGPWAYYGAGLVVAIGAFSILFNWAVEHIFKAFERTDNYFDKISYADAFLSDDNVNNEKRNKKQIKNNKRRILAYKMNATAARIFNPILNVLALIFLLLSIAVIIASAGAVYGWLNKDVASGGEGCNIILCIIIGFVIGLVIDILLPGRIALTLFEMANDLKKARINSDIAIDGMKSENEVLKEELEGGYEEKIQQKIENVKNDSSNLANISDDDIDLD